MTKKRAVGFNKLKVKAAIFHKMKDFTKRRRLVKKLGEALSLNHRKLVLSFCIGVMVDRYHYKVDKHEKLRQLRERKRRDLKANVFKELNQYRVGKMQGKLSAQFHSHVIKTKIFTSFKLHTGR